MGGWGGLRSRVHGTIPHCYHHLRTEADTKGWNLDVISRLALCTVLEAKITNYLLDEEHPIGRHKARFFVQFGFSIERWQEMASALTKHPSRNPIEEINSPYGKKYVVQCSMETPDGRNPCIVTV